jgi:Na+/phosphate symporter
MTHAISAIRRPAEALRAALPAALFVSRTRDLGRVAIGLGLMLFALQQLLSLITPYEDVPSLRPLMGTIATQPIIAVIIAAVLTWAAHSSVATVLLTMSLAAKGSFRRMPHSPSSSVRISVLPSIRFLKVRPALIQSPNGFRLEIC